LLKYRVIFGRLQRILLDLSRVNEKAA